MIRFATACLMVCAAGALAGAWQEPHFRGGTDTVSIQATVLDRDGRLVTDLARDDFEVLDDGRRQGLTVFASESQPLSIVLMLDRSSSTREHYGLVHNAASEFINQLRPDDRARIGSFSETIRIDPEGFTSSHSALRQILDENLQAEGPTPLWNATVAAMDALVNEDGRRVVLLFTDGRNTPDPGRNLTFDEVRLRAQTTDVMVYAIGLAGTRCVSLSPPPPGSGVLFQRRRPGGVGGGGGQRGPRLPGGLPRPGLPRILPPLEPTRPRWEPPDRPAPEADRRCFRTEPDSNLRALAEVGGGAYFELDDASNLRSTFTRIADELHHQYAMAYPMPAADGKPHQIEVRLRRSGLTVRARRGYIAPVHELEQGR
jgi:VWFA-related protein